MLGAPRAHSHRRPRCPTLPTGGGQDPRGEVGPRPSPPEDGVLPVQVSAGTEGDEAGKRRESGPGPCGLPQSLASDASACAWCEAHVWGRGTHNCDLLVLGPELAMLRIPRPVCDRLGRNSSRKGLPQDDSPPGEESELGAAHPGPRTPPQPQGKGPVPRTRAGRATPTCARARGVTALDLQEQEPVSKPCPHPRPRRPHSMPAPGHCPAPSPQSSGWICGRWCRRSTASCRA